MRDNNPSSLSPHSTLSVLVKGLPQRTILPHLTSIRLSDDACLFTYDPVRRRPPNSHSWSHTWLAEQFCLWWSMRIKRLLIKLWLSSSSSRMELGPTFGLSQNTTILEGPSGKTGWPQNSTKTVPVLLFNLPPFHPISPHSVSSSFVYSSP